MTEVQRKVEQIARLSYGRLVALLAFRTGSISRAEDALGDALIRALETWPMRGIPKNPEGWILKTARNKAVDGARTEQLAGKYHSEIEMLMSGLDEVQAEDGVDPRLKLMFACAHPAIDAPLRAPLMLQTVLGLDARRMASAYLVSPGTLGQRLTRAKAKIEKSGIPMTLPTEKSEYDERLGEILAALYAAYAVGTSGAGPEDNKATNLVSEAIWLVSTICAALPAAAEAHGLFALMLYTESRRPARTHPQTGQLVPLDAQDTTLWRADMVADADQALRNAQTNLSLGRFQIEASIQAVHMDRRRTGSTNWLELQTLYRGLVQISPTVGALTGQAVVEAEIGGPALGLKKLEQVEHARRETYQPWHAARAHFLAGDGQIELAVAAFDMAIGLSNDPADRAYLRARRAALIADS